MLPQVRLQQRHNTTHSLILGPAECSRTSGRGDALTVKVGGRCSTAILYIITSDVLKLCRIIICVYAIICYIILCRYPYMRGGEGHHVSATKIIIVIEKQNIKTDKMRTFAAGTEVGKHV